MPDRVRIVAALLGVGVVSLVCGCASVEKHPTNAAEQAEVSQRWATAAELRWLQRVGRFTIALQAQLYADTSQTSGTCSSRLRDGVGRAPTARLDPVVASLAAACRDAAHGRPATADQLIRRAKDEGTIGIRRRLPSVRGVVDTSSGGGEASHTDPLFNAAATAVADKRVVARCWSFRDWRHLSAEVSALAGDRNYSEDLGFAVPGGGAVDLSPTVCGYLDLLVLGGAPSTTGRTGLYVGVALSTLAHEAEHARGVVSETKAQCYAIQMIPSVGERLGLGAAAARRLTDAVWRVYQQTKLAYWSRACKAGGPYDLHLHDPAWP